MIFVISPAKKLDFSEETRYSQNYSMPSHIADTGQLLKILVKKSVGKLQI